MSEERQPEQDEQDDLTSLMEALVAEQEGQNQAGEKADDDVGEISPELDLDDLELSGFDLAALEATLETDEELTATGDTLGPIDATGVVWLKRLLN